MIKKLDSFSLKMIGIVLMVFDHIHQMWAFDGAPIWLTMVGRVVAPIFLFLAAEGVFYTRNRWGYLRNLLVGFWLMSLISQILSRTLPNEHIVLINNIFGTLFLAALLMTAYDLISKGISEKLTKKVMIGSFIFFSVIAYALLLVVLMSNETTVIWAVYASMVMPSLLTVEGGFVFVLLGLLFFIFRTNRIIQVATLGLVALLSTGFQFSGLFSTNFQWMMIFAAVPMLLYSGKEGRKMKWFFYFFYPIHLIILYVLATLVII